MHTDSSVSFPPVRRLGAGDLTRCVALAVDRGWAPEKAKWSLLLATSEAFGLDAPDGRGLAGAVVLTRYGTELASAGMMLVAARYARRGLGRVLMEHLLAQAGGATVTLFATDMGRPLYEKLGFRPVRRSAAFVGLYRPAKDNSKKRNARHDGGSLDALWGVQRSAIPWPTIRAATEADLAAILEVDKAAFGVDRSRLLGRLPEFAEQLRVLVTEDGIIGYAAAWRPYVTTTVVGPVVAPDPDAAKLLIVDLAAAARTPVRLDLDPDRPELPAWAHAHGLEAVSRTLVMAHGADHPGVNPDRVYAPVSLALT